MLNVEARTSGEGNRLSDLETKPLGPITEYHEYVQDERVKVS